MLLGAAFTVLLLLVSGVSSDFVPPPTNVTVNCQNMKITVSWDYTTEQPQTVFRVSILRSTGPEPFEDNTTDRQYDLSRFVWQSERHYLAFLYVTVAAVQGGVWSEAIKSKTFSFNSLKTVDIKCVLDFPRVRLNVGETRASVTFQNPLKLYTELSRTSELKLTVSAGGTDSTKLCVVEEDTCKVDVTFPEGEKCIRLTGMLFDHKGLFQVLFKDMDPICLNKTAILMEELLAVILVPITGLVVAAIVLLIYWVKAWTMNLPKSLVSQPELEGHHPVDKIKISPVFVNIPSKSPSIRSDSKYSENCQLSSTSSGSDGSDGPLYRDRGDQLDSWRTDEDSAADSMKTDSGSVCSQDEGEVLLSPYDSPRFLTMDLGDGDVVTGYTGRKPK